MTFLAFDPLWVSHISIQMMAILDFRDILMTHGLDVRMILLNK